MPCLLGCLALSTPRFVLLLVFVLTHYLGRAYETNLWPFLGFVFLPCTTLAYAAAMNENQRAVSGWWLALVIFALAVDVGLVRIGRPRRGRPQAPPAPPPSAPPGGGRTIDVQGGRVG